MCILNLFRLRFHCIALFVVLLPLFVPVTTSQNYFPTVFAAGQSQNDISRFSFNNGLNHKLPLDESITQISFPFQQGVGIMDENRALIIGIIGFVVFQSLIILVLGLNLRNINAAEKALRLSEDRWKFALEGSGDGVWDWDFRANRIDYSPRYIEMLGYETGEFSDRVDEWTSRLHPDDRDRALADLDRHLRREVSSTVLEFRMLAKDGSYRWILGRGKIISRADDGTSLRMVGTHTDITHWKWVEEEIRQANATLEQRVQERTAQLEAANRELEAFSYSVSHDLRVPLRGIDSLSQLIIDDYGADLPDEGIDSLNSIRQSSQQMADLIDGLLNLSRAAHSELHRVEINLAELAKPIAESISARNSSREVTWQISDPLPATADISLTKILLNNLLDNAWKFTAKRPTARIELGMMEDDIRRIFFVRDDGVGFDMSEKEKLFEAFQRLQSANQFEGTGIGLATVKRIVQRHGGSVWAESAPEQGTTVYFTLPS